MELILWRHAKAEPGFPDLARQLTAQGRENAKEAAQWLNARLSLSCRILVSPAQRTRQTAEALARPYDIVAMLAPEATVQDVFVAAGWPQAAGVTLIVGHQPTLGETAAHLLGEIVWTPATASLCWLRAAAENAVQEKPTLVAIFTPSAKWG